ncbi:MAG: PspC domain-containing protein [Candidatus Heimdallarchaeota archaeon]|nr:PspC domain-containing protein [Candidatus Heimdallarchaeota archaeon]
MICGQCGTNFEGQFCPNCGTTVNYVTTRQLTKGPDKMIDGICSGFALYLNIDVTIVRLLWVLFTLAGGAGIILYLVCIVVLPEYSKKAEFYPSGS